MPDDRFFAGEVKPENHISRWPARVERPAPRLSRSTCGLGGLHTRKNAFSNVRAIQLVEFRHKRFSSVWGCSRISTSRGGWRAWGARHRIYRDLGRGLGCKNQEKIRNPISGRSGWSIFTKNSKVGFDEKSEHFRIRRWLARMENPITDLLGCT